MLSERVASPGASSSIVSNKLSSSKIIASFSHVDMSSLPRAIFHGAKNTAPTPPVLPCSGDDLLTWSPVGVEYLCSETSN